MGRLWTRIHRRGGVVRVERRLRSPTRGSSAPTIRIALAHVGIGNRGQLVEIAGRLHALHNVEATAVCDLWKVNRERAVSECSKLYGRTPRAFQHLDERAGVKDIDAVLIATPEHSHSPILEARR